MPMVRRAAVLLLAMVLAGCGASSHALTARQASARARAQTQTGAILHVHPHAIEPSAGAPAPAYAGVPSNPVGDPSAHAPPLSQVRQQLKLELVAVRTNSATYINPLHYVTCCGRWERTDQGVDATMPVGAPIFAPCPVKILAIEPNWYAGQPLVYWELLNGPDAGKVQYVAEEITSIARPGSILQQGQAIARYAPSGTGIEFGWSTPSGVTLAVATGGYEEGQITPAGRSMRAWLNALGANAGPNT